MPPKKKDKSKQSDWLECALCERLICFTDGESHTTTCDGNHGYIQDKVLHGIAVNAETLNGGDGSALTKSIRNGDSAIWLSVSAMQVCGLAIGQLCLVNDLCVMRSWPSKMPQLTSVALSSTNIEILGTSIGDQVTVQRFYGTEAVADACALKLQVENPLFQTDEFCKFSRSFLDGTYITDGSPLQIKYFGQVCKCVVVKVHHGDNRENNLDMYFKSMSNVAEKNLNISSNSDVVSDVDSSVNCNNSLLDSTNNELSESLAELAISESPRPQASTPTTPASTPTTQASTPKLSQTNQKFPNLMTPVSRYCDKSGVHLTKQFSRISSSLTTVSISSELNKNNSSPEADSGPKLTDLGGLSSQIEELLSRIYKCQQSHSLSRCVLMYGAPGTGKSLLGRALTAHLGLPCVYLSGTDVWSKLFGEAESNLNKLFKKASDKAPSIVVIDDIDVICPKRSKNQGGQQESRIVGTLLSLIDSITAKKDSAAVVILGITNNREGLDPALRRAGRFGCEVEIPVPSAVARLDILKVLLKKFSHQVTETDLATIANNAHGYVGADLAALVNEACMHAQTRISSYEEKCTTPVGPDVESVVEMQDLVYGGLHVKPSALREVQLEVPQVRWSDIGGMSEVKMRLREAVELPLSEPQVFKNLGIDPPRGLLMYGPPGCSKTMVARALATECSLNFLAVKGPELFNQYVGESEKAIREVFRKARSAAPSVIFFDEIDAIAAKRGSGGSSSGVEDRVLTQLLTEMDGLENLTDVFIMAATNRPDKMDNALLRPGRFDSLVYVPLPDDLTRREILQKKMSKMCVDDDVVLEDLVGNTLDYSGAEIIQVCQEAALFALREDIKVRNIGLRHFELALTKVQPQIDPELLQVYNKFSQARSR